ncbi:hypothetical protein B7486_45740 [cyanobacterium TDX16]|nr:hypothetical protein B7486_45740 [cyanobacterium TDX16]
MLSHEIQTIDAFGGSTTEYSYEPEIQDDNFETECQYLSVDPDDTEPGLRVMLTLVSMTDNKAMDVDVLTTSQSTSIALFQAIRTTFLAFSAAKWAIVSYRLIEDAPF